MKRTIKNLQDMGGLHDMRTYTGAVRKSAKPDLPTTAILGLYMSRNEKERITQELKRLKKRKTQLQNRLKEVDKEMVTLLEKANKTASELFGSPVKGAVLAGAPKKKGRLVLGY